MSRYPVFWQVLAAGLALMLVYWLFASGVAKSIGQSLLSLSVVVPTFVWDFFSFYSNEMKESDGFFSKVFTTFIFFMILPAMVLGPIFFTFAFLKEFVRSPKTLTFEILKVGRSAFGEVFRLIGKFLIFWVAFGAPLLAIPYFELGTPFIFLYYGSVGVILIWLIFIR
jgi:hypothetical protein